MTGGMLNIPFLIMIVLLPTVLVFGIFVFLFFREIKHYRQRFLEEHQLADEHILREVERFVKEQETMRSQQEDRR